MDFLGIGYQEILLSLIVMFIFVGPQRMPLVAYQIGRAVRQMQRYARAVRDEFNDEFEYIETQYNTIRGDLTDAKGELKGMQSELKRSEAAFNAELKDVAKPIDAAVKQLEPGPVGKVVPISSAAASSVTEADKPDPDTPKLVF